jgi:hypothetical protein
MATRASLLTLLPVNQEQNRTKPAAKEAKLLRKYEEETEKRLTSQKVNAAYPM